MPEAYQRLGRYHIVREIAHGGMATVYRGVLVGVEGFEKDVAIKKIQPYWSQQKEFVDMLIDEARTLLHLHHPHIVEIIELGKESDVYFIVMEYVDGFDLRAIIKKLKTTQETIPPELACTITKQVCLGLEFAHSRKNKTGETLNIVHRDISPQNILISCDGHVKITDFGIAKIRGKSTETAAGFLKGKFSYMSPEQTVGSNIDARTDIFALGAVLYEMLTGIKCFDGKSDLEIIEKVKRIEADFSLVCDPTLRHIIQHALSQDPSKRYQTATEMRREIEAFEKEQHFLADANDLKLFLEQHLSTEIHQALAYENEIREHTQTPYRQTRTTMPLTEIPPQDESVSAVQKSQYSVVVGPEGYARESTPSSTRIHEKTWVDRAVDSVLSDGPVPSRSQPDTDSHSTQSLFKLYRSPIKKFQFKRIHAIGLFLVVLVSSSLLWLFSTEPITPTQTQIAQQPTLQPADTTQTLPAEPSTPRARLLITAFPDSAHIEASLNGKVISKTGVLDQKFEMESDSLNVPVTVSLNGYDKQELTITFDRGHLEQKREIELAPQKFGVLRINSRPWGFVTIENIGSKQGAISLFKVPVGKYPVRVLSRDRKQSATRTVDIQEGAFVECTVTFSGLKPNLYCK